MFLSTIKNIPPLAQYVFILLNSAGPLKKGDWENWEKIYLKRYYVTKGGKHCAEHLHRDVKSVQQMIKWLRRKEGQQ